MLLCEKVFIYSSPVPTFAKVIQAGVSHAFLFSLPIYLSLFWKNIKHDKIQNSRGDKRKCMHPTHHRHRRKIKYVLQAV